MREISLHILDIAENSVNAKAKNVTIYVTEDTLADRLRVSIEDDGVGMTPEMVARVTDPFTTTRTTRKVGLGLPLLKAAAEACEGFLVITSTLGKGTLVNIEFKRSHIDRMPMGDLPCTIQSLFIGFPKIHWVVVYRVNDKEFTFDSAPIIEQLDGISLTEPAVLTFLSEYIGSGINAIKPPDSY